MLEITREAARLLERAQIGEADAARERAEEVLRSVSGDLADGPACMHFVRMVTFIAKNDPAGAIEAAELMLPAAEREGSAGCRLVVPAQKRVDTQAEDRRWQQEAAAVLGRYGVQLDTSSCRRYAAAIGSEPFPYQWCHVERL